MSVFEQHGLSCPVTLGKRTAMSEEAWLKVCTGARNPGQAFRGGHPPAPLKICGLCKGKHRPKELEIIEMVKVNCESCGEEKNTSKNRGKMMCTSCAALYSAAANRPVLVLQILRELKPELLDERLSVQDNVSELEKQLHHAQELASMAEEKVGELELKLEAIQKSRDEEKEEVSNNKHNNSNDSALLDLALDALKGEITGLKPERIEALRGM